MYTCGVTKRAASPDAPRRPELVMMSSCGGTAKDLLNLMNIVVNVANVFGAPDVNYI